MKTVQKANKQLRVADDRLPEMRNRGFAEIDEKTGKPVAAPVVEDPEVKDLKTKITALKKEKKELQEQVEALTAKVAELEAAGKSKK